MLGVQMFLAFLVSYIVLFLFLYKADPRFSLKYKKTPSFYYLLTVSTLGTAVQLLILVAFSFFFHQDLIVIFSIDSITFAWQDVLLGLLAGGTIFLSLLPINALISVVRRKFFPTYKSRREGEVKKIVFTSLPKSQKQMLTLLTVTSLKAAVTEELIFRGYLLRSLLLLVSPAIAIVVQAVFFFAGHLYQGIFNAILPLIYGILLGLVFYLTGSLTVVMINHFIGDVIGLAIQAVMIRKR